MRAGHSHSPALPCWMCNITTIDIRRALRVLMKVNESRKIKQADSYTLNPTENCQCFSNRNKTSLGSSKGRRAESRPRRGKNIRDPSNGKAEPGRLCGCMARIQRCLRHGAGPSETWRWLLRVRTEAQSRTAGKTYSAVA